MENIEKELARKIENFERELYNEILIHTISGHELWINFRDNMDIIPDGANLE